MNRGRGLVLFCACLSLLLGCGARTSTLEDEGEFGGSGNGGSSGSSPNGGASPAGGAFPQGGTTTAGAAGAFGGGFPSGGGPGAGGPSGGAPAAGAGGSFGGGVFGGAPAGGAPSGGFGATGGFAGDAGAGGSSGGLGELCTLGNTSCDQCVCKTCSGALLNCFGDSNCTAILACVAATQCQNLGCYAPNTCQSVIDKSGGLAGSGMSKLFSLIACTGTSQSSCGCN